MQKVTKDMTVMEALQINSDIAGILMQEGMHCIFCGAASMESLQEAGYVHGINDEKMDELIDRINDFIAGADNQETAPVEG